MTYKLSDVLTLLHINLIITNMLLINFATYCIGLCEADVVMSS
jgi:hypothetical protein